MAYTRPAYNDADVTWYGAPAYARPPYTHVYGTWSTDDADGRIKDDAGPLQAPALRGVRGTQAWQREDAGPLQAPALRAGFGRVAWLRDGGLPAAPQFVGATPRAHLAEAGPLQPPLMRGWQLVGWAQDAGALGAPQVFGHGDFTAAVDPLAPVHYVADLIVAGTRVRAPVSSASITLQVRNACYAACTVPACAPYLSALQAATEFVVLRRGQLRDGTVIEQQLARMPLQTLTVDRGPWNYTASVSGYGPGYAEVAVPDARYDRALRGVRSISTYATGTRVRCEVDWLLQPGQRAWVNESLPLIVAVMNVYVSTSEAYMDVSERIA